MSDSRIRIGTFLGVAFGWSWICWVPLALASRTGPVEPATEALLGTLATFGAWGPLLGALTATGLAEGANGIKALLRRVLQFRIGAAWYLVVLLLFPLLIGGALAIAVWSGEAPPDLPALAEPIALPIAFLWILVLGGPLQEELGWRGVLQERLQERWDAVRASLVVGITWGLWHLPLFFVPREEFYYNRPIWGLVLTTTLISVLFTWVYNNTGRSLWAVLLLHTSFNWSHYLFPSLGSDVAGAVLFGLQGLAVLVVVVVYGHATLVRGRNVVDGGIRSG